MERGKSRLLVFAAFTLLSCFWAPSHGAVMTAPQMQPRTAPGTVVSQAQAPGQGLTLPTPESLVGKLVHRVPLNLSEARQLEPVCVLVLGTMGPDRMWYDVLRDHPALDRPHTRIAKGAISFHHYCWGEVAKIRSYAARDPQERRARLESSATEYRFIIEHPQYRKADWMYLADMYVSYGDALLRTKNEKGASTAYLKALEINPSLESAYLSLSNYMQSLGRKAKALEYVREGLRHNPGSRKLLRHYKALGGTKPLPDPYPVATPELKAGGEPKTAMPTTLPETRTPAPARENEQRGSAAPVPQPVPASQPVPSYNKPPYCRFCP